MLNMTEKRVIFSKSKNIYKFFNNPIFSFLVPLYQTKSNKNKNKIVLSSIKLCINYTLHIMYLIL